MKTHSGRALTLLLIVTLSGLLSSEGLARAQATRAAGPPKEQRGKRQERWQRVQIKLARMPSAPFSLRFEKTESGERVLVTWDPASAPALVRYVALQPGRWQLSSGEPSGEGASPEDGAAGSWRDAPSASSGPATKAPAGAVEVIPNLGTQTMSRQRLVNDETEKKLDEQAIQLEVVRKKTVMPSPAAGPRRSGPPGRAAGEDAHPGDSRTGGAEQGIEIVQEISVRMVEPPTIKEAKDLLLKIEPPVLHGGSRRSTKSLKGLTFSMEDEVPAALAELFQILGEVAVEKAKSKGFALLSERIKKVVCVELPDQLQTKLHASIVKALRITDEDVLKRYPQPPKLLGNTCAVVSHLRLADLSTIRKPLLSALLRDLGELGLAAVVTPAWMAVLNHISETAVNQADKQQALDEVGGLLGAIRESLHGLIIDQTPFGWRDAQQLLLRASQVDWTKALPKNLDVGCGVDLTFAIVARCAADQSCNVVTDVAAIIDHPPRYFNLERCNETLSGSLYKQWPDIERFVARAIDVFMMPPEIRPEVRMKGLITLTIDIVDRILEARPPGSGTPEEIKKQRERQRLILGGLRQFTIAATSGDIPEIIVAIGGLTQGLLSDLVETSEQRAALAKALQMISAVTAYASTYVSTNADDIKQRHEARKKAIEDLVDSATSRTERSGDWIVSVGGNVGASLVGGQYLVSRPGLDLALPQLSLPLGVAVQKLARGNRCGDQGSVACRYLGFHLQISPIDLGQFVSYDGNFQITSTRWANFVTAAVQAGALIGPPSSPFMVGLDLRWAPTLFTQAEAQADPMAPPAERGGAFRFGLFFGYYVPFFDFN